MENETEFTTVAVKQDSFAMSLTKVFTLNAVATAGALASIGAMVWVASKLASKAVDKADEPKKAEEDTTN